MPEAVTVEIPYTLDNGEVLVNESFGPKNIHGRRTGMVELKTMQLLNGRALKERLSLDEQGFVFVSHPTRVADFFDEKQLTGIYYPEIEQLIREQSGATRVVIFDHALRSGDETEREEKLIRNPVLQAHNDYTEWSGPNRLRNSSGRSGRAAQASFRDHSGVARDQSADPVQSAGARRREKRRFRGSDDRRAPLPAPGRPDLSAEIQSAAPLGLFSRDAPRRSGGVQSLRLGQSTRAIYRAHILQRSGDPAGRAAAPEHRDARLRFVRRVTGALQIFPGEQRSVRLARIVGGRAVLQPFSERAQVMRHAPFLEHRPSHGCHSAGRGLKLGRRSEAQ